MYQECLKIKDILFFLLSIFCINMLYGVVIYGIMDIYGGAL